MSSSATAVESCSTIDALLAAAGLETHAPALHHANTTLSSLQALLAVNRPHLLEHLRELGVSKLGERQKLANALAKAQREGQLPPPPAVEHLAHFKPPIFVDDESTVTVWLKVATGTSSNQLKMHVDANSLRVEYCGEPTAVRGKLQGTVKAADCGWQLERAPAAEYNPLLCASEQAGAAEDEMVISLQKERPGAWAGLFTDAIARRFQPAPKAPDEKALALRQERQSAIDIRKHEMLYGYPLTPMPPKNPELVALEKREAVERQRRWEKRRAQASQTAATLTARQAPLLVDAAL